MSRTKGYKCYNIQCGSCIGKTLCCEPGDAAPWCQDRVFDGGIHMDYKNLVDELNRYSAENQNHGGITAQAADSITDLLARAEAAEAREEKAETLLGLSNGFVSLHEEIAHWRERAEKAETERDEAVKQLHGKCSACKHYSAYHQKGKCKNCCWDNANPACLREYQEDNWEWKGTEE